MKVKRALPECQVFATLSDAELEKIASLAVEKEYEAGATLFQESDSPQELFVLEEGKIAVQMILPMTPGQTSRRVTVDVIGKNEVLGWSAIVEPHFYTLAAVCLQKTRVLAINATGLRALLRDNHHLGYEVMKGLIKVVASRLEDTRHVLLSERWLTTAPP